MKRVILLLVSSLQFLITCAQPLMLEPLTDIHPSYFQNIAEGTKQTLVIDDTLMYAVRGYGLEELNINTGATKYFWRRYHPLEVIEKDTGSHYIFLSKNGTYLGRFDHVLQQYKDIWPDSLSAYGTLNDICVTPNGKVWAAVNSFNFPKMGVFDGNNWTFFSISNNLSSLAAVNDTLVYGYNAGWVQAIHNGKCDSIYKLPGGNYLKDMDVDTAGNLWIAAGSILIRLKGTQDTLFDLLNTPIGSDQFYHVKAGSNGHIWTTGNKNKMLEWNGTSWQVKTLPVTSIENFSLNSLGEPYVISNETYSHPLHIFNGSSWNTIPFPFMPMQFPKAMDYQLSNGYFHFATDDGFFKVNQVFFLDNYFDTTSMPFADDVTCFAEGESPMRGSLLGTAGVYSFDNTFLKNKKVNAISRYYNGNTHTYYIGTDSGLVAYDLTTSTYIDTSVIPLPSQKITAITTGYDGMLNPNGMPGLYIGTDKGFCILENNQWRKFDTTNIPLSSIDVTGISRPYWSNRVYVATRGNGLIGVDLTNWTYELYNTANGKLADDTLFYVFDADLGACMNYLVAGTANHGIAHTMLNFPGSQFTCDTVSWSSGISFKRSTLFAAQHHDQYIVSTNAGLFTLTMCLPVPEYHEMQQLTWIQSGNQLHIFPPDNFSGKGHITISNVLGQTALQQEITSQKIVLDIAALPTGIYIARLYSEGKTWLAKALISR